MPLLAIGMAKCRQVAQPAHNQQLARPVGTHVTAGTRDQAARSSATPQKERVVSPHHTRGDGQERAAERRANAKIRAFHVSLTR